MACEQGEVVTSIHGDYVHLAGTPLWVRGHGVRHQFLGDGVRSFRRRDQAAAGLLQPEMGPPARVVFKRCLHRGEIALAIG